MVGFLTLQLVLITIQQKSLKPKVGMIKELAGGDAGANFEKRENPVSEAGWWLKGAPTNTDDTHTTHDPHMKTVLETGNGNSFMHRKV